MWDLISGSRSSISMVIWCLLVVNCTVHADDSATNKNRPAKAAKVVPVKTLAPLLKSRSESLFEKGVAKVTPQSLENEEIFELLAQFVERESKTNQYSAALIRAIGLLGEAKQPRVSEILGSLLSSGDYRIVMLAADAASARLDRDLLKTLMQLPDRPEFAEHYGFRRCVVDAVARFRDKSVIDFLVERLGKSDGQLKYEIAMILQRATGQEFGGKYESWKKWWQTNQDSFEFGRTSVTPPTALKVPPKQIPWDEPRPTFYGMPIYAKRVVFIIDRSGSMGIALQFETRLERAQSEVQKAITNLSETDSFNVVAFDDQMDVFQRRLMPATPENKLGGIQFAYGLTPRGGTACYEPLKMGLEASNDLELILFVSDGEPTAGALIEPSAIVVAISNHNLTQRTTINALGIDARGPHESFLKGLADKNSGKLLLIR